MQYSGLDLSEEFDLFQQLYTRKFEHFYPAKNSTGFNERNLSVNFAAAYERLHTARGEDCFTWFEFQFGVNNNLHLDACIINLTNREILLIESKRLKTQKQTQEIADDVNRINTFDIAAEFADRLNHASGYNVYGVILADIWTENDSKIETFRQFCDSTYQLDQLSALRDLRFYTREFIALNSCMDKWMKSWKTKKSSYVSNKDNYKIVGFSWSVSGKTE